MAEEENKEATEVKASAEESTQPAAETATAENCRRETKIKIKKGKKRADFQGQCTIRATF